MRVRVCHVDLIATRVAAGRKPDKRVVLVDQFHFKIQGVRRNEDAVSTLNTRDLQFAFSVPVSMSVSLFYTQVFCCHQMVHAVVVRAPLQTNDYAAALWHVWPRGGAGGVGAVVWVAVCHVAAPGGHHCSRRYASVRVSAYKR